MTKDFDLLVSEAERQPFSGWDFSFLRGRYLEETPSWDYKAIVRERMKGATSMLDLATAGGELLSSLQPLPSLTFATESYGPNVSIARRRLAPLGVSVVDSATGVLPFEAQSFDLVTERHESYDPGEVFRVLRDRGRFLTQQVGPENNRELRGLFNAERPNRWTLESGVASLEEAGFDIVQEREELHMSEFLDVGALVYYLKAIPWEVPGFSARTHEAHLREADELIRRLGRLEVTNHRCLIEAARLE